MSDALTSDELGEVGESLFNKLCAQAKLVCNKSGRDRTGWDFRVEFPMDCLPDAMLDQREPRVCQLQLKCTAGERGTVQARLSAIERIAKDIAVIELGDWRRYDDPNVILVSDLVQVFIPDLDRERTGAIVAKLPAAAIKHLSSQLTTAIVQNDREVAERRDRLAVNGGRA